MRISQLDLVAMVQVRDERSPGAFATGVKVDSQTPPDS